MLHFKELQNNPEYYWKEENSIAQVAINEIKTEKTKLRVDILKR